MEQKQLDEMESSSFNEEFIDEDDFLEIEPPKEELKEEPVEEPAPKVEIIEETKETKVKKEKKKPGRKKSAAKKSAKVAEVKKDVEITSAKEEIKIEKVEEVEEPKHEESQTKTIDPWAEENEDSEDDLFNKASVWKVFTGIAVILLVFSIFTQGFNFADNSITSAAVLSLSEAEEKALGFVNTNLLQAPFVAELVSSEDTGSLYKIVLSVAGQEVESYMSKDGELFFPQGFNVNDVELLEDLESTELETNLEVSIDDDEVKGDLDAPVTIIEFSDFECPFCGRYITDTYPDILENYVDTGKVRYVFRDFPLSFHSNAQKAAEAAECAAEQEMFWEMHDLLFENQNSLDVDSLKGYAEELGLDTTDFNDCLDSGMMAEEVENDFLDGQSYGVAGTPAFFINGKLISGALPYDAFEQEIEAALANLEEPVVVEETEEEVELVVEIPEEVEEVVETEEVEETSVEIPTGETKTFTLKAKKWSFTPDTLTVNQGDIVRLTVVPDETNPTFTLAEFTFAVPELDVEEEVSGKTTVEFVATETGEFDFKCGSCEDWRGMSGTLTVE